MKCSRTVKQKIQVFLDGRKLVQVDTLKYLWSCVMQMADAPELHKQEESIFQEKIFSGVQ